MPVLGNTFHRPRALSEAPRLWRLIERAAVSAVGMGAWRARAMVVGRWYRMTGCAAEEPWDTGPSAHTAGLAGPVGQSCWNRLAALSGRTKDTVTMSPLVRLPARQCRRQRPPHMQCCSGPFAQASDALFGYGRHLKDPCMHPELRGPRQMLTLGWAVRYLVAA